MRKFIQKHYLSSFYFITLIFSFLLLPLHSVFKLIGNYSVSFPQLAPAIGVVFMALILSDKSILHNVKSRLFMKLSSGKLIVFAVFLPIFCVLFSSIMMSLFKITYTPWKGNVLFYILNIIAMLVGCLGEEIGWRGFLLPNLQKKHSPFISSIMLGLLWGIWHLNFTGGILGFILYTFTIIEMSILMTWLFNKSNGNLLLMITWHFIFNLSSHIFLWERFGINMFIVQSVIFGIGCILIVYSNRKEFFNKSLHIGTGTIVSL